jgi:hypothetical protein
MGLSIESYRVTSRQERGRWRSGEFWPSGEGRVVAAEQVTPAMREDPYLSIELEVGMASLTPVRCTGMAKSTGEQCRRDAEPGTEPPRCAQHTEDE